MITTIIIMNESFRSPVFDDKVNHLWHQLVKSLPMLVVFLEWLMAVYLYRVAPPQVLDGSCRFFPYSAFKVDGWFAW